MSHNPDGEITRPPEVDRDLAELLVLVGKKDQVAFQRLYRLTSGHLFAVLLRILKHDATAEEALQESYMKIWRNSDSHNPSLGRPLTWMTSVARYHALDVLRSTKASRQRDTLYQTQTEHTHETQPSSIDLELADSQLLSICLERIDPRVSQCIIKTYCEGYTHEELSKQTDTPLGTVKSWIRRALATLKDCINELS